MPTVEEYVLHTTKSRVIQGALTDAQIIEADEELERVFPNDEVRVTNDGSGTNILISKSPELP